MKINNNFKDGVETVTNASQLEMIVNQISVKYAQDVHSFIIQMINQKENV